MNPFEKLIPQLLSRVAVQGEATQGGPYARLDNDVYFQARVLGKSGPIHPSFELRFLLFFNPDGSRAAPPIEILDKLQGIHLGYDFENLGGIFGRAEVREAAGRIRRDFGLGRPSLFAWSVKESRAVPPGGVRHWGVAGFVVNPSWRNGPERYDWPALGSKILSAMDTVLGFLELARPGAGPRALEPR